MIGMLVDAGDRVRLRAEVEQEVRQERGLGLYIADVALHAVYPLYYADEGGRQKPDGDPE